MDQLVVDNLLAWARGQAAADAGPGDTLAAEEAGVILCRHDPWRPALLCRCWSAWPCRLAAQPRRSARQHARATR